MFKYEFPVIISEEEHELVQGLKSGTHKILDEKRLTKVDEELLKRGWFKEVTLRETTEGNLRISNISYTCFDTYFDEKIVVTFAGVWIDPSRLVSINTASSDGSNISVSCLRLLSVKTQEIYGEEMHI